MISSPIQCEHEGWLGIRIAVGASTTPPTYLPAAKGETPLLRVRTGASDEKEQSEGMGLPSHCQASCVLDKGSRSQAGRPGGWLHSQASNFKLYLLGRLFFQALFPSMTSPLLRRQGQEDSTTTTSGELLKRRSHAVLRRPSCAGGANQNRARRTGQEAKGMAIAWPWRASCVGRAGYVGGFHAGGRCVTPRRWP